MKKWRMLTAPEEEVLHFEAAIERLKAEGDSSDPECRLLLEKAEKLFNTPKLTVLEVGAYGSVIADEIEKHLRSKKNEMIVLYRCAAHDVGQHKNCDLCGAEIVLKAMAYRVQDRGFACSVCARTRNPDLVAQVEQAESLPPIGGK